MIQGSANPTSAPFSSADKVMLDDSIIANAETWLEGVIREAMSHGISADPIYGNNVSTSIRNCKFILWLSTLQDLAGEAGMAIEIWLEGGTAMFSLPIIARAMRRGAKEGGPLVTLTFLMMDLWPMDVAVRTVCRRLSRS